MIEVQGVVRTRGGVFALVMPFFEHDDFRQVMKTLTLSGVAVYLKSLLTALAHVHAEGVIHRDVKPRNFMYNARTGQGVWGAAAAAGWVYRQPFFRLRELISCGMYWLPYLHQRRHMAPLEGSSIASATVGHGEHAQHHRYS